MILCPADEGDEEGKGQDDRDDNSDDSEDEEWESEDGGYEDDMDEDGFEDMDDTEGNGNAVWKKKSQDPFAPAEMYLSDMIGSAQKGLQGNDDENQGDYLLLNVSSNLVFSPPRTDPLASTDLQGAVIELLRGLKGRDSKGKSDGNLICILIELS